MIVSKDPNSVVVSYVSSDDDEEESVLENKRAKYTPSPERREMQMQLDELSQSNDTDLDFSDPEVRSLQRLGLDPRLAACMNSQQSELDFSPMSPMSITSCEGNTEEVPEVERSRNEIPDLTFAPSYERKRIFHELLDKFRGLDETIHTQESSRLLEENINTADALFQQMNASISQIVRDSQSSGGSSPTLDELTGLGSSASEVLLSCMHTKACSDMLWQKVKSVGVKVSVFNFDDFIDNLNGACLDEGEYSEKVATEKLVKICYDASSAFVPFPSPYNAMGRAAFEESNQRRPKKDAKPRQRQKQDNDKSQATQSEILNEKSKGKQRATESEDEEETGTPEALAKNIMRSLKNTYRSEGETPQHLLQICQADNVNDMVTRLFGTAFCVRDGHVGVSVADGSGEMEENVSASLMLRPEKPPQKKDKNNKDAVDDIRRSQVIASFPVTLLKMLAARNQTPTSPTN